ncbi:O-methyltransferase family 3 protein [Mycena chlorophos]|uniref:O-methyltransferase family 3 protein n=1 Tax=Mycena chlorophos TaxID=658473 RepID=A0A8H6WM22_MYCCL|nr:O-methyltransferase family 3 protein [Mycena chlorophos]
MDVATRTEPRLPLELERDIFESVAGAEFAAIPGLLRVAQRVKLWLEPRLYRRLVIGGSSSRDQESLRAALRKPDAFLASAVHQLVLDTEFEAQIKHDVPRLAVLSSVTQVAIVIGLDVRTLLSVLPLRITRLTADFHDLFGVGAYAAPKRTTVVTHPILRSVSHLWLTRNTLLFPDPEGLAAMLGLLPALTHLALFQSFLYGSDDDDLALPRKILAACPRLEVFVSIGDSGDFMRSVERLSFSAEDNLSEEESLLLRSRGAHDISARLEDPRISFGVAARAQPPGRCLPIPSMLSSLPPELILRVSSLLSTADLNSLICISSHFQALLQSELEARLTPELAKTLLPWSIGAHRPDILAKLLAAPYSLDPRRGAPGPAPLLLAADVQDLECVRLLLEAGADVSVDNGQEEMQALHKAVQHRNIPMARLLLEHGAKVDVSFGCDGASENSLHVAAQAGQIDMARMLLDEFGADLEARGHFGTPLGFAVHARQLYMVKFLLGRGADARGIVPLYILLVGGPPPPLSANLVYIALRLRAPMDEYTADAIRRIRERKGLPTQVGPWTGLPLGEEQKTLLALLLKAGSRRDVAMEIIQRNLKALAAVAVRTEQEFLEIVKGMFDEAEGYAVSL